MNYKRVRFRGRVDVNHSDDGQAKEKDGTPSYFRNLTVLFETRIYIYKSIDKSCSLMKTLRQRLNGTITFSRRKSITT